MLRPIIPVSLRQTGDWKGADHNRALFAGIGKGSTEKGSDKGRGSKQPKLVTGAGNGGVQSGCDSIGITSSVLGIGTTKEIMSVLRVR